MSAKGAVIYGLLRVFSTKLDGKKTYIGGAGLILLGILGLIEIMVPDLGLPKVDVDTSLGFISAGLGMIGVGHKIEKNTEITKQSAIKTQEEIVDITSG